MSTAMPTRRTNFALLCTRCLRMLDDGSHSAILVRGAWVTTHCPNADHSDHSQEASERRRVYHEALFIQNAREQSMHPWQRVRNRGRQNRGVRDFKVFFDASG